jgi:hypothetical protein
MKFNNKHKQLRFAIKHKGVSNLHDTLEAESGRSHAERFFGTLLDLRQVNRRFRQDALFVTRNFQSRLKA